MTLQATDELLSKLRLSKVQTLLLAEGGSREEFFYGACAKATRYRNYVNILTRNG